MSLLLLGFVGAGVLQLSSGIGVIIGANVGTTLSSLVVAHLGFGDFSIASFALPLIGLGGLLLMMGSRKSVVFA